MAKLNLQDKYYEDLLPFIKDDQITDIVWNGKDLWIDHLKKGRYKEDIKLSKKWVEMFAARLSNLAGEHFNYSKPLLEAETDDLRISIIHPDVVNQEYSLAIRKTPAIRRMNEETMLKEGYANETLIKLLRAFVESNCSIIVIGEVGAGKTELVKFLTKYIPNWQRTITIEDNYELRLSSICPELDVNEIKINERSFNYRDAIKASLRQKVHNLFLSEARGQEAYELLEAASTGCRIMTTLHCDDVRKVPDRFMNMLGIEGKDKINDIYSFFDVIIKVNLEMRKDGVFRNIEQIGLLDRTNNKNTLAVLYDEGNFNQDCFTQKFIKKFKKININLNQNK